MKQTILYKSGDLFFPSKIKNFLETFIYGSYDNTFYITYWSIMHYISGVICGLFIRDWKISLVLHAIWELWQIFIGMSKPHKIVGKNNIVDIILDTIFFMAGFFTYRMAERTL